MGRLKTSEQLVAALAARRAAAEEEGPNDADFVAPDHRAAKVEPKEGWFPRGGKVARRVFNSVTPYGLVYGERYSGKTVACLHRLVRHCYENNDALAVIVTLTRKAATFGGPWETLIQHILPEWAEGIGLQGEGPNGEFMPKRESNSQTPYVWIGTADGGWSRVILLSLQFGDQIAGKIKNMAFSFFFFDELHETDSERYFLDPIQQLRRRGVTEKLFLAACNPAEDGPDHWVYKRWFIIENQNDPAKYKVFHLPIAENVYAPEGEVEKYIASIYEEGKTDPTAIERKIFGKWVRRPRGDGLLAKFYVPARHQVGDATKKLRLLPSKDWRIIKIGYDPGPANFNVSFMQRPPNREERALYGVFDEVVHIADHTPYPQIVREVLRKMNFWCQVMETPFIFQHIADEAAFNQIDNSGSYEARKIRDLSKEELKKYPERYPHLKHIDGIRLLPCPKPAGSVPARVMMVQGKLIADEIRISAMCPRHVAMMMGLEENKNLPMHPLKDAAGYIHTFDAMSYVMYFDELGGRQPNPKPERQVASDYVAIGG